jgi:hypothetical protein
MGYAGKQIIHPDQIAPVQAAFSPSEAQQAYAKAVLEAYELAETEVKTRDLTQVVCSLCALGKRGFFISRSND